MESVFPEKEMYLLAHTNKGKPTFINSKHKDYKMYDNMHLADGMEMVEYHGVEIPLLKPYVGTTEFEYQPFSKWRKLDGKGQAIHFFMNDNEFRTAVWGKLENATYNLRKFDALLTPDFSMYVDMMSFYGLQAVFMTRFVGAYWQKCGYEVIPTASWGNVDSFKYAFVGLPANSVIAVCGVGNKHHKSSFELWKLAIQRIEAELTPIMIVVYGEPTEVSGIRTPMKFIPDYITTHFRYGNTGKQVA